MSLTKLTDNLNSIQSLPNKPSQEPEALKAKFDESANLIKKYINEVLTKEIENLITNTAKSTKITVENVLTSEEKDNALSAYQGKVLKSLIDNINSIIDTKQKAITTGTSTPNGGNDGDIYIQYF